MATQPFQVVVHGAREVEAAFTKLDLSVDPVTGKALRAMAVPVRNEAQELAVTNIGNMGPGAPWSRLKIGRRRTMVYIAERQKRQPTGSPRTNLWNLMMGQALIPALQHHEREIKAAVAAEIDRLCRSV